MIAIAIDKDKDKGIDKDDPHHWHLKARPWDHHNRLYGLDGIRYFTLLTLLTSALESSHCSATRN